MVFIEPTEEVNITCAVCKAEMPAVARFCGKCGAPRAYATGSERYEGKQT
jgi:predicted amidophosphoribosyltransferase